MASSRRGEARSNRDDYDKSPLVCRVQLPAGSDRRKRYAEQCMQFILAIVFMVISY